MRRFSFAKSPTHKEPGLCFDYKSNGFNQVVMLVINCQNYPAHRLQQDVHLLQLRCSSRFRH